LRRTRHILRGIGCPEEGGREEEGEEVGRSVV
jgi:hypothetical protein